MKKGLKTERIQQFLKSESHVKGVCWLKCFELLLQHTLKEAEGVRKGIIFPMKGWGALLIKELAKKDLTEQDLLEFMFEQIEKKLKK